MTRLAFYNITEDESGGNFVGLPTTLMGILWSAALTVPLHAVVVEGLLVVFGMAMVAPVPIPRPGARVIAALVLLALVLGGVHVSRIVCGCHAA